MEPNLDEIVTLVNKKSGDTVQVPRRELPKYGKPVTYTPKFNTVQKLMGGGVAPGDIPSDPIVQAALAQQVEQGSYKPPQKPESAAIQKMKDLGTSGMRAVNDVESIYTKDPSVVIKQLIPGHFASRKFDSALFQAVDALLRLRTGAVAPVSEVKKYMSAYGPTFGDSKEDAMYKIQSLRQNLRDAAGGTASVESQSTGLDKIDEEIINKYKKK